MGVAAKTAGLGAVAVATTSATWAMVRQGSAVDTTPAATGVMAITLHDGGGIKPRILDLDAALDAMEMPGRDRKRCHVVPCDEDLAARPGKPPSFGTIVGRFADRMAKG